MIPDFPVGSYIWLKLVDVLKHGRVVLTWLLAVRWWIILCSNVHILSDFMKQTTLSCPVLLIHTHTQTHTPPTLSSLLICLFCQFNFFWSKGAYPICILIALKVLRVQSVSDPHFEYEMWIWNYYFYAVIKMNLRLKVFLSWQTQLHHVHCVSWNIQKS